MAEAAGARSAKSRSRATSRPTRSPGLTITSSQRRLAGGRYQGPALRSPSFIVNGPRRVTRTPGSLNLSVPLTARAATAYYPTPTAVAASKERPDRFQARTLSALGHGFRDRRIGIVGAASLNLPHFTVLGSRVASVRVTCRSGLGRRD